MRYLGAITGETAVAAGRDTRRQIAHHAGKPGSLGFQGTLCRIPEPAAGGTGPAQPARPAPPRRP